MYKAIHHDGRKPLVDIASYLQRHDIVYRRPSLEPFEGLPLGDGRLGDCSATRQTVSPCRSITPT